MYKIEEILRTVINELMNLKLENGEDLDTLFIESDKFQEEVSSWRDDLTSGIQGRGHSCDPDYV